jgi:hypothetical protein
MSKPTVPDAVLAERERISKILYLSGVTLPASTEAAIRTGQDARRFRVGRDDGDDAQVPASAPAVTETAAGKRPWSEITARFNRPPQSAPEQPAEAGQ